MHVLALLFAITLAYASLDLARRRARARRRRAAVTSAPEPAPVAWVPGPLPSWVEGAELDGGYLVGRQLGAGGFGVVHVVEHRALERTWAAKVIRRDRIADATRRRQLLHELTIGLQLAGHPHIVRTELFRSFGDEIAIFSELVDGPTLAAALSDLHLATAERALTLALQLAWALAAIHAAGLIHADVKPGNVLLTRGGDAKLADLGLASLSSGRSADAPGTPRYRSPEQARRQPVTAATDVWSWAVTMIAVLLGEEPGHAGGELAAHTLSALRARQPAHAALEHLDAVLVACLHKAPDARPTMTDVVDQLSVCVARCTGVPPPRPPAGPAGPAAASKLELLTQALQPLIDPPAGCPPEQQDRALRLGFAKADCHRRAGDLAGAVTTLQRVLAVTPTGAAALRAAAWLDVGALYHERAAPDTAIHAFEQAASSVADPVVRARAHRGAGIAGWVADDRAGAIARLRTAAMLAAHAADTGGRPEARQVHAQILLDLARMLHETGDRAAHEACLAHVLGVCRDLDETGRQTLVRALVMHGDFERARRAMQDLLPASDSPAALEAHAGGILIAATIDLEEARMLTGQPVRGISLARRACDRLRPLAMRGIASATLPLAVAEVHCAWLSRASGQRADRDALDRALITLDDAARTGRRDAAALADWARTTLRHEDAP
jgi:serine/threonine protein kinase